MGLYTINCPQCKAPYYWFSGSNSADQRCPACKNPQQDKKEENRMDYEQAHLDGLNKVISVQNELITFLKAEVERLKLSQLYIGPPTVTPPGQTYPGMPYIPGVPINPIYPWYGGPSSVGTTTTDKIVIGDPPGSTGASGAMPNTAIIGSPLPPGSIQSIVSCQHEMVRFGDAKSGGERCSKGCGFGSGWVTSSGNTTGHVTINNFDLMDPNRITLTNTGRFGS